MQKAFFSRKLSYTFRRYFTYEKVSVVDFRTDTDNSAVIKIAERVFPTFGISRVISS